MSKTARPAPKTRKQRSEGWPLVVYVWMVSLGFLGYLVVRIGFDAYPHPVHWLAGLGGAVLGCGVGWLWYYRRGDII